MLKRVERVCVDGLRARTVGSGEESVGLSAGSED